MRSNVTPRPSEQASRHHKPTEHFPTFHTSSPAVCRLHLVDVALYSQECSLSPCWPDCISVLMYFSGFTRSDVYSLQHYLQHCIAHIKLEIVCVCVPVDQWVAGCLLCETIEQLLKNVTWEEILPFIHVSTTISNWFCLQHSCLSWQWETVKKTPERNL